MYLTLHWWGHLVVGSAPRQTQTNPDKPRQTQTNPDMGLSGFVRVCPGAEPTTKSPNHLSSSIILFNDGCFHRVVFRLAYDKTKLRNIRYVCQGLEHIVWENGIVLLSCL